MVGYRVTLVAVLVALVAAPTSLASAHPLARAARVQHTVSARSSTPAASDVPLRLLGVEGSSSGVAWNVAPADGYQPQTDVEYSAFGGAQNVDAGPTGNVAPNTELPFSLVQNQLYVPGPTGFVGTDITTGQPLSIALPRGNCIRTGSGCFAINQIGANGDYQYAYTDDATSTTTTYGPVLINGTSAPLDSVWVRAIDPGGAVLEAYGSRAPLPVESVGTLDYLDFATGDYTVLDGTDWAEDTNVAMDSDHVVWTHDEHALYLNRSDMSAAPQSATPDDAVEQMALNGDTLAYLTMSPDNDSDGPHTETVHTGPLGGGVFTAVPGPSVSQPVAIDNGDFAVVSGTTLATFGIYRVIPGRTALGPVISLFGFVQPTEQYPPGDFTATGASAPAVIGPAHTWSVRGGVTDRQFGATGDIPAVVDNAAGVAQIGVFRPATGTWYTTADGTTTQARWGVRGDIPVAGHYAGDHAASVLAVFRPSTGRWYIHGTPSFSYGHAGDTPVPGAYFGTTANGHAEQAAVFRSATGTWYLRGHGSIRYGRRGDIPVPGDYDGNGTTDIAVYRPATGRWYVRGHAPIRYGQPGDIPVTGDFSGAGHIDIAVYRPSTSTWWIRGHGTITFGAKNDVPVEAARH